MADYIAIAISDEWPEKYNLTEKMLKIFTNKMSEQFEHAVKRCAKTFVLELIDNNYGRTKELIHDAMIESIKKSDFANIEATKTIKENYRLNRIINEIQSTAHCVDYSSIDMSGNASVITSLMNFLQKLQSPHNNFGVENG